MDKWFDDTGWLHYHPNTDERHFTDGFGDSPHHTGFYFTAKILTNTLSVEEQANFKKGFALRNTDRGLTRHPRNILEDGSLELCNRDQMMAILFPIHAIMGRDVAREVYAKTKLKPMFPNNWLHMQRQMGNKVFYPVKIAAESTEFLDVAVDKISPNASSIIKNFLRLEIADFDATFLTGRWSETLNKAFDRAEWFEKYFTYKHASDHNPPPVHLAWEAV